MEDGADELALLDIHIFELELSFLGLHLLLESLLGREMSKLQNGLTRFIFATVAEREEGVAPMVINNGG